jgi:hypothetical protein
LILGGLLYELSSAGKTITAGCLVVVRGVHGHELSCQRVEEGLKVKRMHNLDPGTELKRFADLFVLVSLVDKLGCITSITTFPQPDYLKVIANYFTSD